MMNFITGMLFLILVIVWSNCYSKDDNILQKITYWTVLMILMMFCVAGFLSAGYEDGQIDAINGKIKYELVKQSNGETEWEKINEDR